MVATNVEIEVIKLWPYAKPFDETKFLEQGTAQVFLATLGIEINNISYYIAHDGSIKAYLPSAKHRDDKQNSFFIRTIIFREHPEIENNIIEAVKLAVQKRAEALKNVR